MPLSLRVFIRALDQLLVFLGPGFESKLVDVRDTDETIGKGCLVIDIRDDGLASLSMRRRDEIDSPHNPGQDNEEGCLGYVRTLTEATAPTKDVAGIYLIIEEFRARTAL